MYSRYFSVSYLYIEISSFQSSNYMFGGGGGGGWVSGGYNDSIVSLLHGVGPGHGLQDTTCGHMRHTKKAKIPELKRQSTEIHRIIYRNGFPNVLYFEGKSQLLN
jgi:hypothetical protein